jgi:hypothetical protein
LECVGRSQTVSLAGAGSGAWREINFDLRNVLPVVAASQAYPYANRQAHDRLLAAKASLRHDENNE